MNVAKSDYFLWKCHLKMTIFVFMLETMEEINFKTVDPEFILNFCRDVNNDNGTKIKYVFRFIDSMSDKTIISDFIKQILKDCPIIYKFILDFQTNGYEEDDLRLIIESQKNRYDISEISKHSEDIFNSHKGIDFIYYTREQQIRILKDISKSYDLEIFSDEMLKEKDMIIVKSSGIELRVNFEAGSKIYIRNGFGNVGEYGYINLRHYNRDYKIQKMLNPVIYKQNEFKVTIMGVIKNEDDDGFTHNIFFNKIYKIDPTLYNENVIQKDLLKIVYDKTGYILKYNAFEIGKNEVKYYYRTTNMKLKKDKTITKVANLIKEAYYK